MDGERRIRTETILLTAGLLLLGYLLGHVALMVFAAVVLAVGLDGAAQAVAGRFGVARGWAVAGVGLCIAGVTIGALGLSAARLVQQLRQVGDRVDDLAQEAYRWLGDIGAMDLVENLDARESDLVGRAGGLIATVMDWGLTAVGAVSSLSVVLILALFLVADPNLYRRGAIILLPADRRAVVQDTLSAIAHALRWWFLGQIASMALIGVTVGLGTLALGIDLWLALAVLTALLAIVPYIGTLVAAVPILAVGFAEGVQTGIIVLVGYIVIQTIEGEIVMPMIHQRAINLAPALLIATQVLLGVIFGIAGLILAAPLTVVAMVAVQKLWVEHTLGERPG